MGNLKSKIVGQITSGPNTLIIGDLKRWEAMGRALPRMKGMFFANAETATGALIDRLCPDVVLSPLITREFDAFDIAQTLNDIGFKGLYRILADNVPDVDLIQREIRKAAPLLDLAVVNVSGHPGLF